MHGLASFVGSGTESPFDEGHVGWARRVPGFLRFAELDGRDLRSGCTGQQHGIGCRTGCGAWWLGSRRGRIRASRRQGDGDECQKS
jgi:hypothetical protein